MGLLRTLIVAVTAAIAIAYTAPDLLLQWHPFGNFGFVTGIDGRIVKIYPGMAAQKAGLRVGDAFDVAAASERARRSGLVEVTLAQVLPGVAATFPLKTPTGDRNVTLVATAFPRTLADNVSNDVLMIAQLGFIVIGAALLLIRPSLLTWAFYTYALAVTGRSILVTEAIPDAWVNTLFTYTAITIALGLIGFMTFALMFPRDRLEGWRRAVFPGVIAYGALELLLHMLSHYEASIGSPAATALVAVTQVLTILAYLGGLAFFATGYTSAAPTERPRIRWVIFGFITGFGGYLTLYAILSTIRIAPPVWVINVLQACNIAVPITVAYAIVKHRVIDIRFFLSRALVYGLLTTIAIGILVLLDWAVARQLEASHLGIIVEVVGALALGLAIHRMHDVVDRVVDRFVFRSVHDADRHIEKIGTAMMFAQSVRAIDGMLCTESARALFIASVAIFRETLEGSFDRVESIGWSAGDIGTLDRDDPLVLQLHAERHALDVGEQLARRTNLPRDIAAPLLAIPLVLRHRMLGFALFGAHTNGSAIDPNEREILERFVHRATAAYDHMISEERSTENDRLRLEVEVLRSLVQTRQQT